MNEYVKKKVIRLPFPDSLYEKLETDELEDCEAFLEKVYRKYDMWESYNKDSEYFEVTCVDSGEYYLDYVVGKSYEDGEYGYSWNLTDEDVKKYAPLFDRGEFSYQAKDLRKVCYCGYDGYDMPDYYEVHEPTFENM